MLRAGASANSPIIAQIKATVRALALFNPTSMVLLITHYSSMRAEGAPAPLLLSTIWSNRENIGSRDIAAAPFPLALGA